MTHLINAIEIDRLRGQDRTAAGWGENDEVVRMYDEMMGPSR